MKCRPEEALFTCFPTTLMYIFFFKGPVDDPYRNLGTCPPGYRSQKSRPVDDSPTPRNDLGLTALPSRRKGRCSRTDLDDL